MISRDELRSLVEELSKYSSPATTLLSLYIPAGYPLGKVMDLLREEYSLASNIKTKKTQQDVMGAISRAMDILKQFRKTPENGLVIFVGNVSENPSKDVFRSWVFEPPEPINVRIYRTDKRFVLDPLLDILRERNNYGIIIIEKDHATIGLLSGRKVQLLDELVGQVPGKTRAGGQSARRYERLREQAVHEFFKRVANHVSEEFLPLTEDGLLVGVIIGGPAYAKEDFIEGDYLDYRIREKIIGTVDTSYQGEFGLKEVLERAEDLIKDTEYAKERRLVEEFIRRVVKSDNLVAYGKREVMKAAEIGAIEVALVAEELQEVIKELEEFAEKFSFEVFVVSKETEEGQRFRAFSGVGALLRFPIG